MFAIVFNDDGGYDPDKVVGPFATKAEAESYIQKDSWYKHNASANDGWFGRDAKNDKSIWVRIVPMEQPSA